MKRLLILFVVLAAISAMVLSGCKGSTGDTGAQGSTGPQGATGPTLPSVSFMSPGQSDTNVPLDSVIRVGFTKDMLASSVTNTANFTVTCEGVSIPGTISYNSGSKTAYFDPADGLPAFSYITVTLTSGMQDSQANALPQYTASFYTGGSFAPSRLYVGSYSAQIGVFNSPGSAGANSLPDRLISGTSTSFTTPAQMWLDSAADRLYVADELKRSIFVFNNASTATGDIAPSRIISGASTSLGFTEGLWLDAANDELYVASWDNNKIVVFSQASTTAGNVTPSRIISGATTSLSNPYGLWLDSVNDRLYVSSSHNSAILVFDNASSANGDIAPSRVISGPTTTLSRPRSIWLDSDQLYVADADLNKINVYNNASTANGDVAPARVISGANTGLNWATGVWLDKATDRLYIGNDLGNNVLVFSNASSANGNITPSKIIPLNGAAGIWLDTSPNY